MLIEKIGLGSDLGVSISISTSELERSVNGDRSSSVSEAVEQAGIGLIGMCIERAPRLMVWCRMMGCDGGSSV